MAKGAIGYPNRLLTATLTPSSQQAAMPASNLISPHTAIKWRTTSHTGGQLDIDFGSAQAVRAVGIFGTDFTSSATWRLRFSATAIGNSELGDSTTINQNVASGYGQAVFVLSAAVNARYIRANFDDTGLSGQGFFTIGSMFAGPLFQPQRNFRYGRQRGFVDPSIRTRSKGGNLFTDKRPKYRAQDFEFPGLTEQESYDAEDIDRQAGLSENLLWLPNPGGAFQPREAIWGTIEDASPATHSAFPIWLKRYRVMERL